MRKVTYLLRSNRPLVGLPELLNHSGVAPEILLAADEDDGETGAEVHDLGNPLWGKTHGGNKRQNSAEVTKEDVRTFSCTLSNESGESTAKQIRMTWESG